MNFDEIKHDLTYGLARLEEVQILFAHRDKPMIIANKTRALANIECIADILERVKDEIKAAE